MALFIALRSLKKKVKLYNGGKSLPKKFDFLPNYQKISNKIDLNEYDLIITCDCGDLSRANVEKNGTCLINIDHHTSNEMYGDINIIDKNSPSASMVVYDFLKSNNSLKMTKDMALCIYVGFVEDTGFFSYGNLDANVLKNVAALVECGVDMSDVAQKLNQNTPLFQVRLRAYIYNNFSLLLNATVCYCVITQNDLVKIGACEDDVKNLANLLRDLATVKLSVLITQKEFGGYKVSLRSKKDVDASKIAICFGGGGHMRAAGFDSDEEPKVIIEKIIEKINF